jgi:hypothetical protein
MRFIKVLHVMANIALVVWGRMVVKRWRWVSSGRMATRARAEAGNFLSEGGGGTSSPWGIEREKAEVGGGAGSEETGSKAERSRPFSGE